MNTITISIDSNGTARFLVGELGSEFVTSTAVVRRASHVEPENLFFRLTFHALRFIFGEKGRVARFTRTWSAVWRVNLAPINGSVLSERWRNRSEAVAAEIAYLNEHFI